MSCPNTNDPNWKKLISSVPENIAYFLWDKYDGNIPEKYFSLNDVAFKLKSVQILQSPKADEIFRKGDKNNWDLEKILNELQVPKEQKQLLLDIANNLSQDNLITSKDKIVFGHPGIGKTGETEQPENTSTRLQQVEELFDSNPELANSVYEALGFNQLITPNDRIVFGHPTIGKSFLKKQGEDKFISLDDDYATEINNKVKEIANKYNVTTYQVKDGGTQKWNNEYNQMMQEMFNVAKQKAISENKTLFTSNTNLLRSNAESFDKVINLTDKEFEKRIQERGAKYDIKEWKSQINEAISKLPTNKVINTDKYLSDLFITPQQKQQAQQLYSQYLDTIFPDSKVKDIVYHFSNVKIDKPSKEKFSLSANINRRKGFFGINKNINPGNNFANVEGTIPHAMLFDMKNPDFGDFSIIPPVVAKDETKDSAIIKQRGDINYYSVFEPEQIHILGSKPDIEGFKNYISKIDKSKDKEIYIEAVNRAVAVLKANNPIDVENLSLEERFRYYKILGIKKSDGSEITLKDLNENPTLYQLPQNREIEEFVASEKTIRDLAARMSDRIGIRTTFESDRTKTYKGKLENGVAYINLAYATLDTPIHEILGHPIIRAIKKKHWEDKYTNDPFMSMINQDLEGNSQLYQNLLKELETGKGKEVLDRIKRDYNYKKDKLSEVFKGFLNRLEKYNADLSKTGNEQAIGIPTNYFKQLNIDGKTTFGEIKKLAEDYLENKAPKYSLEEQQEEAIVELLGLMTAEKLDAVKDGKLISILKRLLKEIKAFMRDILFQKEVEIDKLPDNMTLGDLSDLLAYSNSKLILPGYEVVYTTPDNMKFKTYSEASKHISDLAKSVKDVDLSNIKLQDKSPNYIKGIQVPLIAFKVKNYTTSKGEVVDVEVYPIINENKEYGWRFKLSNSTEEYRLNSNSQKLAELYNLYSQQESPLLKQFIEKNKEYEQSKEIIEEWKKVNNIVYNPEEIYSRGQEFSSVVGAYSDFDVNLMMQNLLSHIEDNEKAGGKFAISAYTKPVDKQIGHLEGGGGKIKFKLYPKSNDILWAANTDVYSGSVWDASEKVNKDKKSELLGVSYTKYPSLSNVNTVQPNLANIVDNLNHHHNELGIVLTGNNFRLEYDEDIPYTTKKIIDSVNSILDQKYGKLVEPEISQPKTEKITLYRVKGEPEYFNTREEAQQLANKLSQIDYMSTYVVETINVDRVAKQTGIQPTQTNETLKESIGNISEKIQKGEQLKSWQVHEILEGKSKKEDFIKEKEYTSQALINTKIAKLKEVAKKYPRSLIRSEVKPIFGAFVGNTFQPFDVDELPFQKIPSIKPGVEELFESNPELAKIGTVQQYSQYISTIFPESKVKDIVYHGTNAFIESFDKNKIASNTLNYGFYGKGFYFNETRNDLINWWKTLYKKEPNIVTAIINTKNPYKEASNVIEEKTKLGNKQETEEFTKNLLQKNYDAVLPQIPKEEGSNEYVVFEPEQIHILGNKQDIEGFKEFVKESSKPKVSQITDEYGNTWNEVEVVVQRDMNDILLQKSTYDEILKLYLSSEFSKRLINEIKMHMSEDVSYPEFRKTASSIIWQNEVDNITKRASVINVQGVLKPIVNGKIKSKDQLPGYNRSIAKFINDRHHPLFFPNAVAQTKQYGNEYWVEGSISETYLKFLYTIIKNANDRYSEIDAIEAYEMLQETERGYLNNMIEGGYMVVDGEVLPLDQTLHYQLAQLSDISTNPEIQKYEQVLNSLSSRFPGVSWEWNTSLNTKGQVNLNSGKIEFNPYLISKDSPWHEFGHIIVRGIKNTNPELFEQLKKDVFNIHQKNPDGSSYGIVSELYSELLGTEVFWEEVIVTELGREVSLKKKTIWNKIMDFIKSIFGKSFDNVNSIQDLIDTFSNEFVAFRNFSNNAEVSSIMEQRLRTVNFKSQAAKDRFVEEVGSAVKSDFNEEYKRLTEKIKNSQWKQILNQAEMTFGKHSKNDKTTLSLPEQALQQIVENNAIKQYVTPEQIAEALLDYVDYLDNVNIYMNSVISHIDTKMNDEDMKAESKSALLLHANNLANRFKTQITTVDSSIFKQRLSENNPITIKQDKLLASINKINSTYNKLHTELVYDALAKEFESVSEKMTISLNKDIDKLKESESIYATTPQRKKIFSQKLAKLEKRRKDIPLRENMREIFKRGDIEAYEVLNQTAIYSSDAGVSMIGNMIANFYRDTERIANSKLNDLQSLEESISKDFPSQQLDVREYFKPFQKEVTQTYIEDGELKERTRLSLDSEMNVQNLLNDITKLRYQIEIDIPNRLASPEITEEESNVILTELENAKDQLDLLKSTELEKPFIDRYYEISNMLPKEIRKQRQEIFEAITGIYNTFSGTQITEEGIELIKNLRQQLVDLESPYDAFGNMKQGEEYETAMIIKEWKDKRFEEEVMTWEITDEAKKTFTELYKKQSISYRQVLENPSSTQEEKDEALKAFDNWRELYVRNTISEEFYEIRSEITDKIDSILSKYDRQTMSDLYDKLFTLLKGHKDKNGIYDGTQVTEEKNAKIKEADIAIEEAKRFARIHSTISAEDKQALSEEVEKLQQIQINIPTQYYQDRVKAIKNKIKLEITLAYGSQNLPSMEVIDAEANERYLNSQWYKDNHYEVEVYDKTLGEYHTVVKPLSSWRATVPTNQDYIITNAPSHYWYKPITNPKFRNPKFDFDRPTVKINKQSPYYNNNFNHLTEKQKEHLQKITEYYLSLQKDQYKYNTLGLILPSIQKENWETILDTAKLRNIPFASIVEKAKSLLKTGDAETGDNEEVRGIANQNDEFENALESSSRKLYMRFNKPLPIEQQSFDLMKNLALYTTEAVRFSTLRKHQAKILSSASVITSNNRERNNAKKMLDSFVDRVLFGETIITDNSKMSKILNYGSNYLLGRTGSMALGFNIKSAFKNYTAGISQILIQGGIYNISRKDLAKGYALAHKLTPDFIKYETKAGNKSKDLRLLDYYSSLQKGQYENAHKIKSAFLRRYGNIPQTIKRFRDFTEFEIQATIAFGIMSKYQVKKLDSDTYIPLIDAYEIVNNQLQKRNDVELSEGIEKIIRAEIAAANEKTQGLYRAIYQPHGQKFVLYRVLMLFKKWLYQFADARYFKSKTNYGTGDTRGGFHRELINFFWDTVRFNGNIAASYSGLTREEKKGVNAAIKEYSLIIMLMILTRISAGDSDEDDDQNYKDYISWLLKSTTDELETMNPVFEPVQFAHGFIMQKSNGKNWMNRLSDKTFGPLDKTRRLLFNWELYSSDPYYKRSRGKIDWKRTNPFYEGQSSYVALFGQLLGVEQVSVTPTQMEYSSRQFTDINPKTYLDPLTTKYGKSYKQYKIKKRKSKKTKG